MDLQQIVQLLRKGKSVTLQMTNPNQIQSLRVMLSARKMREERQMEALGFPLEPRALSCLVDSKTGTVTFKLTPPKTGKNYEIIDIKDGEDSPNV